MYDPVTVMTSSSLSQITDLILSGYKSKSQDIKE